eukprot:gene3826-6987_t
MEERYELNSTISHQITKETELKDDLMKKIKNIVKKSETNVNVAYDQLFNFLKSKDSKKRYISLLICNELFKRSSVFRQLMTNSLEKLIEFTITGSKPVNDNLGRDIDHPNKGRRSNSKDFTVNVLPAPKEYAAKLKKTSYQFIEQWTKDFSKLYPKLTVSFEYIKNGLKIKYKSPEELLQEQEERNKILNERLIEKYLKLKNEYSDKLIEIESILEKSDICFQLIVPDYSVQEFQEEDEEEWMTIGGNENEDEDVNLNDNEEIEIDLKQSFHYLRNNDTEETFKNLEDSLLELYQNYIPL